MKKNVLITGGSGFIGSHVADHLSDKGYKVTIYDQVESNWLRNDQEIVLGDVLESEKLNQTISGAYVVYYLSGSIERDGKVLISNYRTRASNLLKK